MPPTVTYSDTVVNKKNNNDYDSDFCEKKLSYPYEIKKLKEETNKELLKIFKGMKFVIFLYLFFN